MRTYGTVKDPRDPPDTGRKRIARYSIYSPKNNFKSSSTVPIVARPKFFTSTFKTFGDKNAGSVGPT